MNKSILLLTIAGIALAILHMPNFMLTMAIITCLVTATVKLFWAMLQAFSTPSGQSSAHAPSPVRIS
ncbi:MAG: hypothetical protein WBC73_07760 [Phormidesmis sp.]